jgi:hypothetical protein
MKPREEGRVPGGASPVASAPGVARGADATPLAVGLHLDPGPTLMKPADIYIDALYDILADWFNRNLTPEEAAKAREHILDCDDDLVPRVLALTRIELRMTLERAEKKSG